MANETTLSSLAYNVPTEYIERIILEYLYPNIVVAQLVQNEPLPTGEGTIWQQTKFPEVTAAAASEADEVTAATRTTTLEANVTVGRVGVNTEITDIAQLAARGQSANLAKWGEQAGIAIRQKIDGDLCALFSGLNASAEVGSTGTDMTVANFLSAVYTLENNNAPYPYRCVLHPIQKFDLYSSIVNTSNAGALHFNLPELVRDGRLPSGTPATGYWGTFLGVPIYTTTEVDTANSDADRAGAMFHESAMALVNLRGIAVEYDRDASKGTTEVVADVYYGVGENDEVRGVPIITDA